MYLYVYLIDGITCPSIMLLRKISSDMRWNSTCFNMVIVIPIQATFASSCFELSIALYCKVITKHKKTANVSPTLHCDAR